MLLIRQSDESPRRKIRRREAARFHRQPDVGFAMLGVPHALGTPDSANDRSVANIRCLAVFFSHWATSRQIDEFDRWSGGPAVPHNSIAACLAYSRSGC